MHSTSYNEMASVLRLYLDIYMDRNLTVVDVGSMDVNGSYKNLIPHNWKYIGVDIAPGKNVDVVMKEEEKLPFEDNSVNIVISGQCLEHVKRPWLLVKEMGRILGQGGFLFICAPAKYHLHNYPGDYWRFHPDAFKIMMEDAGFNVRDVYTNPVDALLPQKYGNPWSVDCWGVGVKK